MEEVRSYWQVASITHFCTIFGKPFKLPTFEPEELEQAFILEIPLPPAANTNSSTISNNYNSNNNNINNDYRENDQDNHTGIQTNGTKNEETNNGLDQIETNSRDQKQSGENGEVEDEDDDMNIDNSGENNDKDPDYQVSTSSRYRNPDDELFQAPQSISAQQQQDEQQQDLHLLVKLAIALLKPHFNSKISHSNWENYLRRIIDSNWVDLEKYPSPFRVPIISQDGVELTKNLTFNDLQLSDKIDLFYALCDYRLWCEDASDALKDYTLEELRLESIGKDSQGYEYWYFSGTRLFRENKELSTDLILRKKRIKELEYKLVELDKARILREQEEKRKAELERAKQLAAEAREAKNAAKKQEQQAKNDANNSGASVGSSKRRKVNTPVLPPRTGLRERRTSTTSNNNDSSSTPVPTRTTSTRTCRLQQQAKQQAELQQKQLSAQKSTRGSRNSKQHEQNKSATPDLPKKSPEEECREELERIAISQDDRNEAWSLICESLEDWEAFPVKFEKSKSTNEKYLSAYVTEEILPRIRAVYAKRAAEIRRKEKEMIYSMASRRVSTRIITKRAQEEEEERKAQLQEAELKKKRAEAEQRLRAELEREMRERKKELTRQNNGITSAPVVDESSVNESVEIEEQYNGRYSLRQKPQQHNHQVEYDDPDSDEFEGIIHPNKLSEFYEAIELVIDTVRTSKHAWPFVDPVPETVPGYYDLIKQPMDLKKLRTKIEFREYRSLIELEKDFQLLVNNCEKFNGPKNVYTKMVYKLWKSFRKNVRLYLQRDLSMDEYKTFIYPPPPPPQPQPVAQVAPKEEPELKTEPMQFEETNEKSQVGISSSEQPFIESAVINNIAENNHGDEMNHKLERDKSQNHQLPQESTHQSAQANVETSPSNSVPPPLLTPKVDQQQQQQQPQSVKVEMSDLKISQVQLGFQPPNADCEEIIIDSYDVPCPVDNFFIWQEETKPT